MPFQALTLPWPPPRLLAVARSHCEAGRPTIAEHGLSLDVAHPNRRRGPAGSASATFPAIICDHPISHLLQGFFGRHDRERFEVFAYSFGPDG